MKVRLICLAVWLVLVAFALTLPAHAEKITVCGKIELPGKDHTLNPNDPPAKQRQERMTLCEQVEMPTTNRMGPINDRKHDPRAWA